MAGWWQLAAVVVLVALARRPLGDHLARVYTSSRHLKIERRIYRLAGIDPDAEQRWTGYAVSLITFTGVSLLLLYGLQRMQGMLPLGVDHPGVAPGLAFHTTASFVSNTNFQHYAGEATLTHLTQMSGLAVQNFLSSAVGMAVAAAMIRGLARTDADRLGNFWVDLVRGCTRVLVPLAFVAALLLVSQGVVQNLGDGQNVETLQGGTQWIPGGPVASQEAIKGLGTNGGGIFNANSAHPFENPTPFTNLIQLFSMLVIPFAFTRTFGVMVGRPREGSVLAAVMASILLVSVLLTWHVESRGSPAGVAGIAGGNLESKEVRFGVSASSLYAASTTGTSNGAVIASHDSFTPFGGAVPLVNILLGEVTPGGVGSGLYGILILAILTVFIAGLMVGRTPEYLGKKIEARDMKLVTLVVLLVPALVLVLTAVALSIPSAKAQILNPGPHGLTEVLYTFASQANNNGSAFAGLDGNVPFFNVAGSIAMLAGRFGTIILVLALAGSFAGKRPVPASLGTFPTDGVSFAGLLAGVIVVVTGLVYLPVLSLGPIAEGLT